MWSNCSSSSADLRRKAADSRYPVINWRTASISAVFNLCGKDPWVGPADDGEDKPLTGPAGRGLVLKSVGNVAPDLAIQIVLIRIAN